MKEIEGWSDSILKGNKTIHYYKNGISLCGRSYIDNGNRYFDKSLRNESDAYSYHCRICIKKQNKNN